MPNSYLNKSTPYQATAICTAEQAQMLSAYHQHRVTIDQHAGILLADFPSQGPFIVTIVFHGLHSQPFVPDDIQNMLDTLNFQIRNNPR